MIPGDALGLKPVIDLKIVQREFTPNNKVSALRRSNTVATTNVGK